MPLPDDFDSVSAPEDFPPTLKSLAALDASFRCPICKDFLVAPVLIHIQRCCHTFCSACIRTCFNQNSNSKIGSAGLGGVGNSQRCPVCKTEAHEEKIKPVPVLETAVANWQEARPEILKLISHVNSLEDMLKNASARPRGQANDVNQISQASSSRSSLNEPSTSDIRVTRSSNRRLETNAETSNEVIEKAHVSKKRRTIQRRSSKCDGSSGSDIEFVPGDPSNPAAMVPCFNCNKLFRNSDMSSHVDRCLNLKPVTMSAFAQPLQAKKTVSQKTEPRNASGKARVVPEDKIPLPHFPSLKNKDFKALLSQHHLPLDGTPEVMTRRLNRYILLHNANLDADPTHRKLLQAIRQEVCEWEGLQEADSAKRRKIAGQATFAVEQVVGKRKILIKSESEYLEKHKDQFASLTAQAAAGFSKIPASSQTRHEEANAVTSRALDQPQQPDAGKVPQITFPAPGEHQDEDCPIGPQVENKANGSRL